LERVPTGYNSQDYRPGFCMDTTLKQRLIGAAVLALVAMAILPGLLARPDVKEPDASDVPLDLPKAPDQKFETRELSLAAPDTTPPPGGVLGLPGQKSPAELADPVTPASTASLPASAPAQLPGTIEPAATNPPADPVAVAPPSTPAAPVPTPNKPPVVEPVMPPTPPAAVAAGQYAVTVGTFGNLANANALVAKLRAAKMPVLTDKISMNGNTAMRIRVGPYADRAAAEAARLRADGVSGASGKVVALDASPVAAPAPASVAKPASPAPGASKPTSAPATATKPAAAPVAASGFAIQLAAPAEEQAAIALRDRARAAGFASFVQRVDTDGGVRYRVRVGPVADRDAATAMRDAVSQKLGMSGNIVAHP
jgi:DedD protein